VHRSTDKHAQLTSTPAPFCPRGCWFRRLQRPTLSIRAKCVRRAERGPAPSIGISCPGGVEGGVAGWHTCHRLRGTSMLIGISYGLTEIYSTMGMG
jgi:hypothetical protein